MALPFPIALVLGIAIPILWMWVYRIAISSLGPVMITTNERTPRTAAAGLWVPAAVAVAALTLAGWASAADKATELYSPKEEDFRAEYERDTANQGRESWRDYWYWVGKFYGGNFGVRGWTAQSKDLLAAVKSDDARDELRATLNDLGRRVAAEWSKDNGIRKIDTGDLQTYGRRLQQAKARDDGSGRALKAALDALRSDIDAKLGRR